MENENFAIIEAVLFASGEPLSLQRLSDILNMDKAPMRETMSEFMLKYNEDKNRGIRVIEVDSKYQLCTKKEYAQYVKQSLEIRKNTPLSQAAMEVLAIVAYNEPVTKSFVEQVRGVDSNYIVNTLLDKGLLEEAGRLDVPGKPISYRTSDVFLRSFDMKDLSELPEIPQKEAQLEIE